MRKIALLMDGWKRYFTFAWPAGLLERFHETDEKVNLYIFNSSGNWSRDEKYNEGEYNIYNLPDFKEFDGIILDLNNVEVYAVAERTVARAKQSGVPVISIGSEREDFYYVGIHNEKAMEEMVDHLIQEHGCRTFWFVTGPEDNYENQKRIAGIRSCLDKHGISWGEEDFYYENYEFHCGVHGFAHFIKSGRELPDAIVCANDNIAVGVCEEAERAGYHAPEDFLITGFDNFDKAAFYTPSITTISHIREEVGRRCAELFLQIWQGKEVPRFHYTNTECKFWESCGCDEGMHQQERGYLKGQIIYQIETDSFMEDILYLEYELLKCSTFAEMIDCIPKCLPSMKCDAMYLVLDPKVNDFKNHLGNPDMLLPEEEEYYVEGYPQEMNLEFSYENAEVLAEKTQMNTGKTQKICDIFPAFECKEAGVNLLFLPLHFRQWTVGYFVIRNAVYLMEKQYLHHVMGALTKAMENLHRQEKLEWMNQRLSALYVRDTLTGMYNRMGYRRFAEKLFAEEERRKNLLILFIDLDRLKYINDNFGHDMGDYAIRAVADAIKGTIDETGIPVRLGGDEFLIIQEEVPAEEICSMIQEIRHKVERAGDKVGLCRLSISAGYVITEPGMKKSLEDYVNEADEMMYQEKRAKKAARK
ncbi:MAG: GGDEF domain-containing protein [Lachnospiraceae bacterium]|nr:GGDEF domain-containing protein [Lachnospiraceae bacterium]